MQMMPLSHRNRQGGFTLVELLISVGLLAVVTTGTVAALLACLGLSSTSKNNHIATTAAIGLAEEIQGASFPDLVTDYDNLNFTVNALTAGSRGIIYVDDTNPDLLQVTISVCWRQAGSRIIGEDSDLDGVLDAGEDTNANGIIDSPVQIVMQVANR